MRIKLRMNGPPGVILHDPTLARSAREDGDPAVRIKQIPFGDDKQKENPPKRSLDGAPDNLWCEPTLARYAREDGAPGVSAAKTKADPLRG